MVYKPTFPRVVDLTKPGTVLLPTVSVKVQAGEKSDYVRGIIAWASQYNLISEKIRKQFGLPLIKGPVPSLHGLGGGAVEVLGRSYIRFSPRTNENRTISLQVFVLREINETLVPAKLQPIVRESLKDFQLADPYFDQPGDVDLVLGVTYCPLTLRDGRYIIPGTTCYAMESIFGWIVVGRAPMLDPNQPQPHPQSYLCMQ